MLHSAHLQTLFVQSQPGNPSETTLSSIEICEFREQFPFEMLCVNITGCTFEKIVFKKIYFFTVS